MTVCNRYLEGSRDLLKIDTSGSNVRARSTQGLRKVYARLEQARITIIKTAKILDIRTTSPPSDSEGEGRFGSRLCPLRKSVANTLDAIPLMTQEIARLRGVKRLRENQPIEI